MPKVVEFAKNIVLTIGGCISIIAIVYVGAVGFLSALLVDKLLQAAGSKLTVNQLIVDFDALFHARYEEYRHSWDNFHFKNLKLPF
jgi:hypothetical protein